MLFKPVHRLATSTMSWSGLRLALRRVTDDGAGVAFLVSASERGPHHGHGVIRTGSIWVAEAGLRYYDSLAAGGHDIVWRSLWRG